MPELPEMVIIAQQMHRKLGGKEVAAVEVSQPKCLNRPEEEYHQQLPGKKVLAASPLGKWVEMELNQGTQLLLSLGMGGELRFLRQHQHPPEKTRFLLRFTDGTGLYITLWWFGYVHLVRDGEIHRMTADLGPDPLSLSLEDFAELIAGRRGQTKAFLLNQRCIRGIGNFYIQEILFKAKLHPRRTIPSLNESEIRALHTAMHGVLRESIELGSSSYEMDFFGRKGKYGLDRISFAYQEDAICPECGAKSEKIKTGSTSHYICPKCQRV